VLWAIPVIFVYLIAAFVFSHYTNAALPYVDSMTATLSLFANYLLMKRKFENWYIWIFVDIVYVGMFTYKGLYTSAILYFILLIIACKGFYSWKKNIIK
jgi:nicotinamide mononucleotide transporter